MYPDFIGIGAQKAGTTWLHRNLEAHPQLWVPRKEVHYFDKKIHDHSNALTRLFGKSLDDRRWRKHVRRWTLAHLKNFSLEGLRWVFNYYMRAYNDRWYASIFEPRKGRIAGEITPAYSVLGPDMVSHVHKLIPEAKIIFMMRNPIERDWSQTVMSFDKVEKGSVKAAAEEELLKKFSRKGSRSLTNYFQTFENWQRFYPEEQIFVGFLEDVHFRPADLLRRLYGFLGVDPTFTPPDLNKKIHTRSVGEMPVRLASQLARTYHDELAQLDERFGGYASFWRYCAERLAERTVDGEGIPYPLWESFLWDDWRTSEHGLAAGLGKDGIQSGPLSTLQAVR